MAIVEIKTKKGVSYKVRVRDQVGRWFPAKTFKRKVDAKNHEAFLIAKKSTGEKALSVTCRKLAFGEFWELWSNECRSNTSEGWQMSQDQMARDYLLPALGPLKVACVRRRHITGILDSMKKLGRSSQTRVHVYNLAHRMFEDAIHHFELLRTNPVSKSIKPKIRHRERKYLSPTQSRVLLAASRDQWFGPAVWLELLTTMRVSDVQALKWEDVDFLKSEIVIRASYKRKEKKIRDYPKQGDQDRVPITTDLAVYLKELKLSSKCEFVAPNSKGGMLDYSSYLRSLKSFMSQLGLPKLSTHELRHSGTELWIEAGATAEDIRRLLNHKSLSVTSKYIHKTSERLSRIGENVKVATGELSLVSDQ